MATGLIHKRPGPVGCENAWHRYTTSQQHAGPEKGPATAGMGKSRVGPLESREPPPGSFSPRWWSWFILNLLCVTYVLNVHRCSPANLAKGEEILEEHLVHAFFAHFAERRTPNGERGRWIDLSIKRLTAQKMTCPHARLGLDRIDRSNDASGLLPLIVPSGGN
jgi:hypothetical protein